MALLNNEWVWIGAFVAALLIWKVIGFERTLRWVFRRPKKEDQVQDTATVSAQPETKTANPEA